MIMYLNAIFSVDIIFLTIWLFSPHVSKHFEEIKLGEIHVDDRISAPKPMTLKQMFHKTLLLRMINSSWHYPNVSVKRSSYHSA